MIDVFRAFSFECYAFSYGAKRIYTVGDTQTAKRLKEQNPEWILAGEREGVMLKGFDTGNAPSRLNRLDLNGKTVVHTTSAGTQGIVNATSADEILGCSLVNAKATAEYIKRSGAKDISLVCMGWSGRVETEEDTLCARYIQALLQGETLDMKGETEKLKGSAGAHFFDETRQEIFPKEDFYMCTAVDAFDFVLKVRLDGKLYYIEKI